MLLAFVVSPTDVKLLPAIHIALVSSTGVGTLCASMTAVSFFATGKASSISRGSFVSVSGVFSIGSIGTGSKAVSSILAASGTTSATERAGSSSRTTTSNVTTFSMADEARAVTLPCLTVYTTDKTAIWTNNDTHKLPLSIEIFIICSLTKLGRDFSCDFRQDRNQIRTRQRLRRRANRL